MIIPTYARYKYCIKKSIEFILNENLNSFPFDSDEIIKKHKWSRLKYSQLALQNNVSLSDIIEAFGTQDGYSTFNGRNYSISYNDTHIPGRIYFTKLHEIGHIYLNHFVDFDETKIKRTSMTNKQYKVLENEANCFARNVIAPAVIVNKLNLNTPEKIYNYFGITESAAKTRLDLLKMDYKYIDNKSEFILLEFWKNNIYKKRCLICNYGFNSEDSLYCPICGNENLILGDGYMKYDFIDLNEKFKAKICPVCENENTNINGDFCQICGSYIKNKCSVCGMNLVGEARFCNHCGCSSTFLESNYLMDWKTAKVKIEGEIDFENILLDDFAKLPCTGDDDADGDLPF